MKTKNIIMYVIAVINLGLFGCTTKEEIFPVDTKPYLNKKDSTLMVEIYNKIGPWGYEWDLENVQTWGGVSIALDTLFNEYRIVGFNYFGEFVGEFPEEFCQLTELRKLGLGGGSLGGCIPSSIKQLQKLEWLYIGKNDISGEIPPEIGKLKKLTQLTIGENNISGKLPKELGELTNMERMIIMSTNISGEIPKTLSKLKKAKLIHLSKNKLEGTFPIEIINDECVINCTYNNITEVSFDIWNDKHTYYIPDFQFNRLSGEIPEWVYKTERWKHYHFKVENQQENYGYD